MAHGPLHPASPPARGPAASPAPSTHCDCAGSCPRRADLPLLDLPEGGIAVICSCHLEPADAAVLRAMGLAPSCYVKMCRRGNPTIVAVLSWHGPAAPLQSCLSCDIARREVGAVPGEFLAGSSRIGLARRLAGRIMVSPVHFSAGGAR